MSNSDDTSAAHANVRPGDVLAGKYRVERVLGAGGMGVVVAAVHIQLDELVALKFMLPHALGSVEAVGRFVREARAAVKLKSEHVARVSDVGTLESGAPYIVMEYLEGTDLAGTLAASGPLPPEEVADYVIQACDALAEAHSLGIVHRDLKPANLFVTRRRDGSPLVKVLDFGISKSSTLNEQSGGESLTKTGGGLMGSPLYMSPEQMKSAKTTDARTDIWALGIIMYELLGGRTPFESDTLGGLMAQVLTEPPPPLAGVRPGLPAAIYEAVGKCLEKERGDRWSNVAELATALASVASPRVYPLVERISGVLGHKPATALADTSGGYRASLASSPRVRTGPGTTAPGWAETSGAPVPRSGKRRFVLVTAAVVVAVAAVGGLALRHGSQAAPPTAVGAPAMLAVTTATASQTAAEAPRPAEPAAPPRAGAPEASVTEQPLAPKSPAATAPAGAHRKSLAPNPPSVAPAPAPSSAPAPTPPPARPPLPAKPAANILDTSN